MIKPEATIAAMREGRITLLIEPVRAHNNGKPPLRRGQRVAVQQRRPKVDGQGFPMLNRRTGRQATETAVVGYLTTHAADLKQVWATSDDEAKRAGFRHGVRQLWEYWHERYDQPPFIDGQRQDCSAWFIEVRWVHERYLAEAATRPPDEHGYQPIPSRGVMQDAGAAVPEDFQARLSRGELPSDPQRVYDDERRRERERVARLSLAEQLAWELDQLKRELPDGAPEYEPPSLRRELERVRRERRMRRAS